MSTQNYYVPDQSRFPIFMAFSLFVLVMGASSTINNLDNPELIPVKASFNRIKEFSIASETVMKLDYLIDYYQSGLSLQVEAILRGRGHFETFPLDSVIIIYDSL